MRLWQVEGQVRQTEELIHQRRLGVLPYLVARIKKNDVELTNIGNGTALNIEFKPKITSQILNGVNNIIYDFEKIPMLAAREKCCVPFRRTSMNASSDNTIEYDEIWSGIGFVGTLIFQDIEGNFYKQDLSKVLHKWVRHEFPTLITQSEVNEILKQSKNLLGKEE